ncbi:hypothetical protein ACLOJK_000099 [Asimina triloba]
MMNLLISLPTSLPFFVLALPTIFFFSKFVSRTIRSLTRAQLTRIPASPLDPPHSQHLDRLMMAIIEDLHVRRYRCMNSSSTGPGEAVECVVCMCKIEEGEEVREISCDHLFHRACLDKWLGYRNPTCPLCRMSLIPLRYAGKLREIEEQEERLVLPFSFLTSTRSTWSPRFGLARLSMGIGF